jgi:photoactive yellow protein
VQRVAPNFRESPANTTPLQEASPAAQEHAAQEQAVQETVNPFDKIEGLRETTAPLPTLTPNSTLPSTPLPTPPQASPPMMEQEQSQLAESLSALQQLVQQLQAEAASISQSILQTDQQIEEATAILAQGCQALDNAAALAANFDGALDGFNQLANQSMAASQQTLERCQRADHAVKDLTHDAQKIGEQLFVIRDVVGRVYLLSLNAAIEAAKAGEAGIGFTVIANELKTLASQATMATEQIMMPMQSIQKFVPDAGAALHALVQTVETGIGQDNQLAFAIAGQAASAAQIRQAVEETSSFTQSMQAATQQMGAINHQLAQQGKDLRAKLQAVENCGAAISATVAMMLHPALQTEQFAEDPPTEQPTEQPAEQLAAELLATAIRQPSPLLPVDNHLEGGDQAPIILNDAIEDVGQAAGEAGKDLTIDLNGQSVEMHLHAARDGGTDLMPPANQMAMDAIRFAQDDIDVLLANASNSDLDNLPFGVVKLDANAKILAYNRYQSMLSHRDPDKVLGKNFFKDVAICADTPTFADRFFAGVDGGHLNAMFDYNLSYKMPQTKVRVHLKKGKATDGAQPTASNGGQDVYWVFIKRL